MNDRVNRYGACRVANAEKLVDAIVEDINNHEGLREDWNFMSEEKQEEVKSSWLDIVLAWKNE